MKIFDVHTHVWPDRIAAQVVERLRAMSQNIPAYNDGTAAGLRQRAMEAGYTAWMNCPVVTRPDQTRGVNEKAAKGNVWPSLSMGGIHPDQSDMVGELQHIRDLGLHGVKLHPEYQAFHPLEKRMESFWTWCEEHRLPVLVHAGNDIGFQPPYHSHPKDFAELKHRYPELILIAAHMGGWLVWDDFERDLMGRDVLIDCSFSAPYLKKYPGRFQRLIKTHGVDKVLYGSDSPWQDLKQAVQDIMDLDLADSQKQQIFYGNANQVFKLDELQCAHDEVARA